MLIFIVLQHKKVFNNNNNIDEINNLSMKNNICITENILTESLDGFVLLVDTDGTILYVTESVSLFLGLTQV